MPAATVEVPTIADQLREAVRASSHSVRALGKLADVDDGQIHRFIAGERGLTLATAGKLAATLGLWLAERPKRPGRRRKDTAEGGTVGPKRKANQGAAKA